MSSDQDSLQGKTIAERYEIERCLSSSSVGSDYLALDQFTDSRVLVKIFATKLVTSGLLDRIQTKSRLLASITSPAVLRITDFGTIEDTAYVVSPFPAGETLESALESGTLDSLDTVLKVAQGTCEALHAAHELDIVHGSLAPDCILLPEDSLSAPVYVFNFGISGFLSDPEFGGAVSPSGQIIGKPEYLSPEHVRGEEITVRSDIYSLGIVLYEMLCGQPPFRAEGRGAEAVMDLLMRQASDLPPSFSEGQPRFSIPSALEELVMEMLAKDTLERPSNLIAISRRLELSASSTAEPERAEESSFPSFDPTETEDTLADIPAEEIARAVDEFEFSDAADDSLGSLPEQMDEPHGLESFTGAFGQQKLHLDDDEPQFDAESEGPAGEMFGDSSSDYSDVDPLVHPENHEVPDIDIASRGPRGHGSQGVSLREKILALPKPFLAALVLLVFGAGLLLFGGGDAPSGEEQLASSFPSDGPSGLADTEPSSEEIESTSSAEEQNEAPELTIEFEEPSRTDTSSPVKIGTVDLQDIILNSRAGRQLEQSYKKLYLEAKKAKNSTEKMKSLNQVNTKVVGGLLVDLREIIHRYGEENGYAIILGSDLDLSTAPYVDSSLQDPVGTLTSTSSRIALDKEISKEFDQLYEEP